MTTKEYLARGAARLAELDAELNAEQRRERRSLAGRPRLAACRCGCHQRLPLRVRRVHQRSAPRPRRPETLAGAWRQRHLAYVVETGNRCPESFGCQVCAGIGNVHQVDQIPPLCLGGADDPAKRSGYQSKGI